MVISQIYLYDGVLLRLTSLPKYLSAFSSGEIKALQPDR